MWRLSDFWKCDVVLGTPPLEKAQEALTALTVFLPSPGPPSAPIPIPAPRYWTHWRCASYQTSNTSVDVNSTEPQPQLGLDL
ncbi:hypothetical protein J6590_094608 [Homalodisca vitripennis]|nr:hypothetical protein J6590_094608 [Homalodisca vitripennis]